MYIQVNLHIIKVAEPGFMMSSRSSSENEDEDWNKPLNTGLGAEPNYFTPEIPMTRKSSDDDHRRVIVHIDIDCFYAQVEMIRNPNLRSKPLGVNQKYLLVTCNYVARSLGVKKMMRLSEAKKVCPQLVIVNGEDLTQYREMSYKITEKIRQFSPLVERLGFDENFVDVTELVGKSPWLEKNVIQAPGFIYDNTIEGCDCGCKSRLLIGSHIAAAIRTTLLKELGITSCAGIAHNKLLAKLVGEVHKPNQQTLLFPVHTEKLLFNLQSVKKIPGIGHSMCKKLAELEVETVSQVRELSFTTLEGVVGVTNAQLIKNLCQGIDSSDVVPTGAPQSMSDEDSFKCCNSIDDAKARIGVLLNSLLNRFKNDGRIPQTLRLTVRRITAKDKWTNRESRQCPIPSHFFTKVHSVDNQSTHHQLLQLAIDLLNRMVDVKKPFHLTLINVCFAKLQEQNKTSAAASITNFLQKGFVEIGPVGATDTSVLTSQGHLIPKGSDQKINQDIEGAKVCKSRKRKYSLDGFLMKNTEPTKQNKCITAAELAIPNTDNGSKQIPNSDGTCDEDRNIPLAKRQNRERELDAFPVNGIDPDVFKQLPPDIQKEVMENQNTVLEKNTDAGYSFDKNENNSSKSNVNEAVHGEDLINPERELLATDERTDHTQVVKKTIINVVASDDTCQKCPQSSSSNLPRGNLTNTVTTVGPNLPAEISSTENKMDTNSSAVNTSKFNLVPPDIDPHIFRGLPFEIQQELIKDWESKKEFSFAILKKRTSVTPPKKQTLLKYFKKK